MRNIKDTEDKSSKPSAEEREIARRYGRKFSRGYSNPRLFDIARTHRVDGANLVPILRKFA